MLSYNPDTGIFRWNIRRSRMAKPGSIAGTRKNDGYVSIMIDRTNYLAHQLAWLYVHGVWVDEIDHRDGDGMNNAMSNLRPATSSQNKSNQRVRRDNTTGFKGVSVKAGSAGFQAKITHKKKQIHIGYFPTAEAAHEAYVAKAKELFGEFARSA
ncbi:HNH endonuclease [uncultured Methylobacterium sp.]|uniref:HNH endonuclease n=1 Tax=uncultured Methylobacterium sp. TaxID=157278 RepID=UPI002637C09C|nr:HNH endonuclease [uncultured Methylobacterium sp.]